MGLRILTASDGNDPALGKEASTSAYHDHRIALGVAEFGLDFAASDAFPHEVNWDLTGSVDFKKGCFIGQEVVSRMQHKAVVRKRVTLVQSQSGGLERGQTVTAGTATVGQVGSVAGDGRTALALLRIDRVAEAITKGDPVQAGDNNIAVDPARLDAYRAALAGGQEAR